MLCSFDLSAPNTAKMETVYRTPLLLAPLWTTSMKLRPIVLSTSHSTKIGTLPISFIRFVAPLTLENHLGAVKEV